MRLLDRYLLRELLVPLGYCLSGILLLCVTMNLFVELGGLQEQKLHAGDIAAYCLVKIPGFLVGNYILPVALLLALLYALTNHSRHHEITAIRGAGISLWRLCLPYLAVGFIASLMFLALNEYGVPRSEEAAEQIRLRRVARPPGEPGPHQLADFAFFNPVGHRVWRADLFNTQTGEMLKPRVLWTLPDGSGLWLYAERAARPDGIWTFYNVDERKVPPQTDAPPVPLLRTNVLARPQFTETPEEITSEIRIKDRLSFFLRGARKADVSIIEILNYLRLHPELPRSESAWLYTKLHGRLATPWTCLVVVLIAIPFGAAPGRRNVYVGVASSILICVVYLGFQWVCLPLGIGGYVPPWLAGWFPNLAFGVAGLWMTARVR